ncbi:glycosyltransferase family 4 protein [Chloroflexales bacterium ZM16-3]|nr:glycosyltransferase family 4 protein [Chloroflexales bacterium ZM16-3]
MERLLVVAPYAVVPPRYGGPLRVYNLCRELSRSFRVAQFAQQVQRRNLAPRLDPVISQVTPTYQEYSSRSILSTGLYALTSLKWGAPPVWQDAVLRIAAPAWLRQQIACADVIHVEHPWQFAWVYRQSRGRVPIILGTQNDEAGLYDDALLHAPKPIIRRIRQAIAHQEHFAVTHASHIITCSPEDAATLAARYGVSPDLFTVVPNGVDCQFFRPVESALREQRKLELGITGKHVVLFAGSSHQPNIEAVEQIIALAQHWPDPATYFLIVGTVGNAFPHVQHPMLHFTGSVDSTKPYFEAADMALNPMLSGSGTNLKQLEFMAMGLPVLTTPIGVRGLAVTDNEHAFIRALSDFPSQLRSMQAKPQMCVQVGHAARRLVEQQFDWPAIADHLAQVYRMHMHNSVSGQ